LYSKAQSSEIKQAFWTAFGKYMALLPSAEGAKTNWINYKTGFKFIKFRMDADNKSAIIAIEFTHPELAQQKLMFDQLRGLEKVLFEHLKEEWSWQVNIPNENSRPISSVSKSLSNVSIYRQEDWAKLISFFKPRLLALDAFWCMAQHSFEAYL
jgi:hypothetical protein